MDRIKRRLFSLFKVKAARRKLRSYLSSFPSTVAELCILYGENEAGMVGELIAFCTSTQKGRLTTETLNSFEHEVRTRMKKTHLLILRFCSIGEVVRYTEKSVDFEIGTGFQSQCEPGELPNGSEPQFPLLSVVLITLFRIIVRIK